MLDVHNSLTGISHPLISSIFLKKDFAEDSAKYHEDVLVIETNFTHDNTKDEAFETYLNALLLDLPDLKMQAEEKVGRFDRVDIRTH